MSILSVPISADLERAIDSLIKSGHGANKADITRKALKRLAEEEAVNEVLRSEQEAREGKILRGDLDELAKKLR